MFTIKIKGHCLRCGSSEKPHYAKGYCRACYHGLNTLRWYYKRKELKKQQKISKETGDNSENSG